LFRAAIRSIADATDRDMGWSRLARGGVEVHHVAGDHENMLVEPHVRVLARELRACIDRGIADTGSSSPALPKVQAL
jgi:thioesterase domain-containing protein